MIHTTDVTLFINYWLLYCSDHLAWLKSENPQKRDKWIQDEHHRTFAEWLNHRVIHYEIFS